MLSIYLISLFVGGSIVGFSALAGGHDGDVDHDFDAGVGADLGLDAEVGLGIDGDVGVGHDISLAADAEPGVDAGFDLGFWMPFLSLRFWTYFAAFFGLTGTLLTSLAMASVIPTLLVSLVMGLGCGTTAATVVKYLQKTSGGGHEDVASFRGKLGTVVLGARDGERGRVRINMPGETVSLPAVMEGGRELLNGSRIVILKVEAGLAEVMACPDAVLGEDAKADERVSKERERERG